MDLQIFAHAQLAVQVDVLGYQAALTLGLPRGLDDIVTADAHLAIANTGQAGEDADGGGLAGTVRPEKGE